MRILFVNTLYYPYKIGGAEISVKHLAEQFAMDISNRVGIITLGEEDDYFIHNNVEVWRFKIQNNYWHFDNQDRSKYKKLFWHIKDVYNTAYVDSITEIIKKFQPDIINTNNLSGLSVSVWNIAKNSDVKIVHTLRDYYLQCPKTTKFKNNKSCSKQCFDCNILSIVKKKNSHTVDSVVGISKSILDNYIGQGYFLRAKRNVIYNGFEFRKERNKKKVFKENDFIVFGFIGQINTSKGIKLLIKSFQKLEKYKNWKLIIAGSVSLDYKTQLQDILSEERISFLGYINSNKFFKLIDVLVVPSIWEEPFGRVVLEGIINKKVVLGSKRGAIPELLVNNEFFQFEPILSEMVDILNKIIQDPKILNEFNFDTSYLIQFSLPYSKDRYLEVFNRTLNSVL